MSQYTQGPWIKDKFGNVTDTKGRSICLSGFSLISGYRPESDPAFANANANLAAAAPELLEELELLVELHEEGGKRTCISARAAIDKAKGE